MPQFYMISDRNVTNGDFGDKLAAPTYWVADTGPLSDFSKWTKLAPDKFKGAVMDQINTFPVLDDPAKQEDQKHVTLFIHGYNNSWRDSAGRYESICKNLFAPGDGLGMCVLFNWPSKASPAAYLADRESAREAAPDLADVLLKFYDMLVKMQDAAAAGKEGCRAKTSIIAHSMGNYVLQNAMHTAWTRKNQPLLVSLVNQLLMVAADVDNDLFKSGESNQNTDGDAIANLTYRVTALYTGRDPVLGLSAGLKHFGKRRLGRSGLDKSPDTRPPDNVWDVDCTSLISPGTDNIHSFYFDAPKTVALMREILRGIDRKVLVSTGIAPEVALA